MPIGSLNITSPVGSMKRPIRIGIVGLGYRSMSAVWEEEMGPALARDARGFQITALCDNDPQKQQAGKKLAWERYGREVEVFNAFEEMYRHAELDAVYIAGPNYLHAEMAIGAMRAGLDVLCEKPIATSLQDADEMNRVAMEEGRVLAFFMQMHYRRRYHRIVELIRAGRIGEPVMTWCTEFRGPFPHWMNWVPERTKSGGALVEKNCHHCDILDLWAASDPVTVYAQGGQKKHLELCGRKSEIIDHAWVTYEYRNGIKAMIGINFTQNHRHQREFGIAGTEGMIKFDLRDGEKLHLTTNADETEVIDCPGNLRGGVLMDFINCVHTRSQPLVNFERARRALLVPLAGELSLQEKRPVHIEELEYSRNISVLT